MLVRSDQVGNILQGTSMLDRISTDEGALESLNKSIDTIYNNFKKYVDVPNVVPFSEYQKTIEPLYNREAVDNMTPAEMHEYSDRFKQLIDDTKPIYIVDDYDNSKIIITLPAPRNKLEHIDNSVTDVCSTYAHAMHLDNNNRMVVRNQQIECIKLAKEYSQAQSPDKLKEAINETDELARQVHLTVHGVDIYNRDPTPAASSDPEISPSGDLFGGFEIVED